jgi:hypothetical protein
MRKLASIQRIISINEIKDAQNIETATILGWQVVVKKNEFKESDLVVYCEIDSVLPDKPEFEFLRERKFRIKTIKLRGKISQGICFPLSILPEKTKISEDKDVTEILGITKFEPYQEQQRLARQTGKIRYPDCMPQFVQRFIHKFKFFRNYYRENSGQKTFPSLIPKTDETRVQVLQPLLTKYKGIKCYITEKVDGCLYENTLIITDSGEKTIKEICDSKYKGKVKSFDIELNEVIWDKISNHSIRPNNNDWYEIELYNGEKIKLTGNHRVWIPALNCYRMVKNLCGDEELLINIQ